ncbi:rhomboid family intramembrane serine protease [bacterium]|nr:rhomboid family intramembrane serine protease [bacterium]
MLYFFFPFATTAPVWRRPWLVLAIFLACLAAYLASWSGESWHWMTEHLVLSPANFSLQRSLASTFLHAGIVHFLGNMMYLYIFGAAVETRLGWWRFAALYFASGLAGDVLYALLASESARHVGTIGASGCVSGVLGAYAVFYWHTEVRFYWWVWLFREVRSGTSDISALFVMAVYFLAQLWSLFSASGSGVNYAAHVGGFVIGVGLAYGWRRRAREDFSRRSK